MKNIFLLLLVAYALGFTNCANIQTNNETASDREVQTKEMTKSFLEMTEKEKAEFVAGKIDEITVKISGKKYPFDSDFKLQVSKYIDSYSRRIGNGNEDKPFGQDLNTVLNNGSKIAPTINSVFDKNGVSRLSGFYIAMIETEFNNDLESQSGHLGLFQILPKVALKYKMTAKDLADPTKSVEIAARRMAENQKKFDSDNMKEFLAILSYNRGHEKITNDLNQRMMGDFRDCSICGMTQNASKLDEQFQMESVNYIPKFLAAAIIGENPKDFGLQTKPLSTISVETSQTTSESDSNLDVSVDYYEKQRNKALETRKSPVGSDVKGVTIPKELDGIGDKSKTKLEEMRLQNFAVPMDFFDLAKKNLNKELVELPIATEIYVLDAGGNADKKEFTGFNFKDGATIPEENSDGQRKLKEFADNFNLDLNNPSSRRLIRLKLLHMLNPKAKTILEKIAEQYQAKFNRPLRVTNLTHSIDYAIELSKIDRGSFLVKENGEIPPHCTGMSFDLSINKLTAEEQNFISNILTEMDKTGKVDAQYAIGPNSAFHIFVL